MHLGEAVDLTNFKRLLSTKHLWNRLLLIMNLYLKINQWADGRIKVLTKRLQRPAGWQRTSGDLANKDPGARREVLHRKTTILLQLIRPTISSG